MICKVNEQSTMSRIFIIELYPYCIIPLFPELLIKTKTGKILLVLRTINQLDDTEIQ